MSAIRVILLDIGGTLVIADDKGRGMLNREIADFVVANKGTYRFVLVSDTTLPLNATLEQFGITDLFEMTVTSGTDHIDKSQPQTYADLTRRLGVPAEACLLIDDQEEFCAAASAAGMHALRYRRGSFASDNARIITG